MLAALYSTDSRLCRAGKYTVSSHSVHHHYLSALHRLAVFSLEFLSLCLSVSVFMSLSACLSVSHSVSVSLSVCLSVCLPVCLFVSLPLSPYFSLSLSLSLSLSPPSLFLSVCLCQSCCPSISDCLSLHGGEPGAGRLVQHRQPLVQGGEIHCVQPPCPPSLPVSWLARFHFQCVF